VSSEALNALKGRLDDVHALADQLLRDVIDLAADSAAEMKGGGTADMAYGLTRALNDTTDELDDIVNRLDRQRTALRGS
jgi:uncharacterized phage infection (PIP) family protein YhgE